jgi:hypothetical protein
MRENQKRVSLYLPIDLYTRCTQSDKPLTELVINGLELILCGKDGNPEILNLQAMVEELQENEINLQSSIKELKEQIKVNDDVLITSNDEVDKDILKLQSRIIELQEHIKLKDYQLELKNNDEDKESLITELKSHNETLKRELQDLKQIHTNYMLQMQTVINQRAIEAPGVKRWFEFWK